ncbi:hypothetical protein BGZ89_011294 [Linnemannia elongata]|nr:hypothetical protein BGZ89_011294 [Linnemannia elongata]
MYVSRVSHWSGDAELDHIGQGCNIPQMQVWRQVALEEYFRHPDPEDSCLLAVTKSNELSPASAQYDWMVGFDQHTFSPASVTTAATIVASFRSGPKLLTKSQAAGAQTTTGKPMWHNIEPPVLYIDPSPQFNGMPASPIDPRFQHPMLIRPRAIKLYSISENPICPKQDRVALFGIHHDVRSNIVMFTGPVFPPSVNWTVEEPTRAMLSGLLGKMMDKEVPVSCRFLFKERGNFRIVVLADGQESEWETICWDIKGDDLRK